MMLVILVLPSLPLTHRFFFLHSGGFQFTNTKFFLISSSDIIKTPAKRNLGKNFKHFWFKIKFVSFTDHGS